MYKPRHGIHEINPKFIHGADSDAVLERACDRFTGEPAKPALWAGRVSLPDLSDAGGTEWPGRLALLKGGLLLQAERL